MWFNQMWSVWQCVMDGSCCVWHGWQEQCVAVVGMMSAAVVQERVVHS